MEERLRQLAAGLGGVLGSRDLATLEVSPAELARLVSTKELVRVRRGAFVVATALVAQVTDQRPDGTAYEREPLPVDLYRLRARAVLRSRPTTDALSHHASAAVHRVAVHGVDLAAVDVVSDVGAPIRRPGLNAHPGHGVPVTLVEGVRCVELPYALVQLAARSGVVAGVCSMDDAVHRGECTVEELRAAAECLPVRPRARALRAVGLVDPKCESVGESRTRLVLGDLGFRVRSQEWLRDGHGTIGRVDFLVDDLVVVEFDGLVKYAGADGRAALAAEKARESRITGTGREVVRVVWADLDDPAGLAARVRVARARALARRGAGTR